MYGPDVVQMSGADLDMGVWEMSCGSHAVQMSDVGLEVDYSKSCVGQKWSKNDELA